VLSPDLTVVPDGFAATTDSRIKNGPMDAATFSRRLQMPNAANRFHFVAGNDITFDSNSGGETIETELFEFASPKDAEAFSDFVTANISTRLRAGVLDDLPGAHLYDDIKAEPNGTYEHDVLAVKGSRLMFVQWVNRSAKAPALLPALAARQYARI
jgi:hypothetical protein